MDTTSSSPIWLRRGSTAFAFVYGLLAVLSLIPAAFSTMMFDAPGSEDSSLTTALAAGITAAPIVLGASVIALRAQRVQEKPRLAWTAFLMPVVLLVYLVVVFVLFEKWCGGSFTCD